MRRIRRKRLKPVALVTLRRRLRALGFKEFRGSTPYASFAALRLAPRRLGLQ